LSDTSNARLRMQEIICRVPLPLQIDALIRIADFRLNGGECNSLLLNILIVDFAVGVDLALG